MRDRKDDRFTAKQAYFVAKEATELFDKMDAVIMKRANDGELQVDFRLYGEMQIEDFSKFFYGNAEFIIQYYEHRGFEVMVNGQTSLTISWKGK